MINNRFFIKDINYGNIINFILVLTCLFLLMLDSWYYFIKMFLVLILVNLKVFEFKEVKK